MKQDTKTAKCIILTTLCNNNCKICLMGQNTHKQHKELSHIKEEIKNKDKYSKTLVLTGGEPTIHPDFIEILRFSKGLGYGKISVISNGRMFSNLSFLKRSIHNGMDEVIFSVLSADPKIHDPITRVPKSLRQTLKGISNLKKLGYKIKTNTVICKGNYSSLPRTAKALIALGADRIQFEFIRPIGNAAKYLHDVVPKISSVINSVKEAIDVCIQNSIHAQVEGIPSCLMHGYSDYVNTLKDQEHNDISKEDIKSHVKFHGCSACRYDSSCIGIWKEYVENMGSGEITYFKPLALNKEQDKKLLSIIKRVSKNIIDSRINIDLLGLGINKRLAKLEYLTKSALLKVIRFCNDNDLLFTHMNDARLQNLFHIYISKEEAHLNIVEEYEKHKNHSLELKVAALLGYPLCCIKKFISYKHKDEKYLVDRFFEENNKKNASFYLNRFSDFILIGHLPHSVDCKGSICIAKNNLDLLSTHSPYHISWITELNKRIVILLGGFFVCLKGKRDGDMLRYTHASGQFNKDSVFKLMMPMSREDINLLRSFDYKVINKIRQGNKLNIIRNSINIFKEENKISKLSFKDNPKYIIFS